MAAVGSHAAPALLLPHSQGRGAPTQPANIFRYSGQLTESLRNSAMPTPAPAAAMSVCQRVPTELSSAHALVQAQAAAAAAMRQQPAGLNNGGAGGGAACAHRQPFCRQMLAHVHGQRIHLPLLQ